MEQVWAVGVSVFTLIVSGGVATWGVLVARSANRIAAAANTSSEKAVEKADEANRISRDANALSNRIDARTHERHDVIWEPEWTSDSSEWRLYNRGIDTARDVTVVLEIRGRRHTEIAASVETDGYVVVELPHEADLQRQEAAESYRQYREMLDAGIISSYQDAHPPAISYRVYWQTPLGALRTHGPVGA